MILKLGKRIRLADLRTIGGVSEATIWLLPTINLFGEAEKHMATELESDLLDSMFWSFWVSLSRAVGEV
jgi:hypothetical protein